MLRRVAVDMHWVRAGIVIVYYELDYGAVGEDVGVGVCAVDLREYCGGAGAKGCVKSRHFLLEVGDVVEAGSAGRVCQSR